MHADLDGQRDAFLRRNVHAAHASVSLGKDQAFRFCSIPWTWSNDGVTPKDRLIACFKSLCDRTDGGVSGVAQRIGKSEENLLQIYRGTKLPSGAPRGVGPELQSLLSDAYPGWDTLQATTNPQWPFDSVPPDRWARLSERQKGRAEQAFLEMVTQLEAESGKRDGTNG